MPIQLGRDCILGLTGVGFMASPLNYYQNESRSKNYIRIYYWR